MIAPSLLALGALAIPGADTHTSFDVFVGSESFRISMSGLPLAPFILLNSFTRRRLTLRCPRGLTVHVARPTRSILPWQSRKSAASRSIQLPSFNQAFTKRKPKVPTDIGIIQCIAVITLVAKKVGHKLGFK